MMLQTARRIFPILAIGGRPSGIIVSHLTANWQQNLSLSLDIAITMVVKFLSVVQVMSQDVSFYAFL